MAKEEMGPEVELDVEVEFFAENPPTIRTILEKSGVMSQVLPDIMDFMAYNGIERLTLRGKTPEEDKKYKEHLKKKQVDDSGILKN